MDSSETEFRCYVLQGFRLTCIFNDEARNGVTFAACNKAEARLRLINVSDLSYVNLNQSARHDAVEGGLEIGLVRGHFPAWCSKNALSRSRTRRVLT
jgi:hypothetical protein